MELKESIKKFKEIANGWKNIAFLSPAVEELAKARAQICSQCPYAVEAKWTQALGDKIEEINGRKCELCGCPLSAATRSVSKKCAFNPPKW